ncbi:MAG TPA: F0F1 ATP synthase subunit delta [Anaerolineae bacterium]|nr:F0F1 ATP synthase subunit delta [Anaerolineae bacterium]HQK14047.1 F0F1 ATP synthase subunit delta [Anaerolineae bacterium]
MLELDLSTVFWQIVNFLIFAALLYYFLFRPMAQRIKTYAAEKEQLMQELLADREATAALHLEFERRMANIEDEAAMILARAEEQAAADRLALMQEVQTEVERILAEAQMDAYRLKRQAVDEFHEDLLRAVLDVSALTIGRVSPAHLQAALLKQLNDSVWELGRTDMQRVDDLRRSLGARTPVVIARAALPLSPEQQGLLVRTFTALADRNITLDLKVEPALGLGIRVRIGDLVLDNTIAGKLDGLRDEVLAALKERLAHD